MFPDFDSGQSENSVRACIESLPGALTNRSSVIICHCDTALRVLEADAQMSRLDLGRYRASDLTRRCGKTNARWLEGVAMAAGVDRS